ncbi:MULTISPECIES: hypothetical protein [unclassified Clostridium]|uniref:hypothetical protein n=1 Tax=unclassified Clostridium TaxID=2614128 RepID=UPI000E544DD0|nr:MULTISPECIES: hypothetical protein [unclassified Clostridium]RHP42179.1 hypothetical protein DWZ40_17255 [Clostridium sp. AF32-12BH]RHV69692.1 hypothetical protein DXB18_00460 [Clostridium sp. OM02-18AC]
MKLWKKELAAFAGVALLTALAAGTAFAAESRTKITSVSLTIDSDIAVGDSGGSVTATANGSNYDVTDVDIVNDDGEWVDGDVPRVEITMEADSDYYFASMSKAKVTLKGDKATYVSSRREDSSSTLIVTVKLADLEGTMEIDDVSWQNDNSTVATWETTSGAVSYQVRLYRGSSSVGSAVSTSSEYYNFVSSITREGEYYFKVRAVNSNNKKGDWYESDYIYVDEDMLARIKAGEFNNVTNNSGSTANAPGNTQQQASWIKDNVGWWYRYANGSYPTNGWLQINGQWYCFDSVGYMRTGWIRAGDGKYYYCDLTNGNMLTNTWTPDNYYVDASGAWVQGRTR